MMRALLAAMLIVGAAPLGAQTPPPDRPSTVMQRDPKFLEVVFGIRDIIDKLESSKRAGD